MTGLEVLVPLIGGVASAGASIVAAGNKPKLPKPEPVKRMPDPESPQALDARRRAVAERRDESGRDGTILSRDEPYSNSLLGQ